MYTHSSGMMAPPHSDAISWFTSRPLWSNLTSFWKAWKLMTTHHFVCMISKTPLLATLTNADNPPKHTGHMTTPTPHPFSGASQGSWTTYKTGQNKTSSFEKIWFRDTHDLVSACQSCNLVWVGLKRIECYITNMTHLILLDLLKPL